ncbi:interleukin-20 receptor subunit alpha [Cheilinus undulatus]|uniref:interleukin-20 receptor subunit alpha n=1 Tax=Cheilinus undulatus TaxID=241271 RepID=UPI001BD50667|nr:interleukin-20 receptor subunit alpha [Cheilinus undulatus]
MKTVLIYLDLLALFGTVSSTLPSPTDVTFTSVNLRNLLQWSPGNGTPNDILFTVQYAIYGDSVEGSKGKRVNWRTVRHCTEIVRHWCDLSNETGDLEQGYHARVRAVHRKASSKWATTRRRFDPKLDTIFGPPLVSIDMEDNNAIITIKGPMRYQPNNQTPAVSMATLYTQMFYNVSVRNIRQGRMSHFPVVSSQCKYRLMEHDAEYCFSVETRFLYMPVHCKPSEWHCIITPPDPWIAQLRWVVVGIVVPSACMCLLGVAGYLLYQYLTGKGQKSPYTLNPLSFYPCPLMPSPETPQNIVLITVIDKKQTPDPESSKKQPHITNPSMGYAPQGQEPLQEPEELSDQSSIDYGFVSKASEPDIGDFGQRERRHDGGVDGNNQEIMKLIQNNPHAPQPKSSLSQKPTSTFSETHMPIRTEVSSKANACLQANSVLVRQSQAPSMALQGLSEVEEEEDREFSGLFMSKTPQTSLFSIPLQSKKQEGTEEMMELRTGGKRDEGNEREPLLSAYASQNTINIPTSQSHQLDYLSDDYGVLSLAAAHKTEADSDDEDEEGEGPICIEWDPRTGKLVLPEIEMVFKNKDGLMQKEEEVEIGGGEEEVVGVEKEVLKLENVYVRQGSEEKAEVLREMEHGGEPGWEADVLKSKWNLIVSMDQ